MAFLPVGRKELWLLFIFLVSYFLKKLRLPLLQIIQRCLKPANLDWPFPSFSLSSQQSPSLQVSHSTAFTSHSTLAAKRQPLAQLFVSKQTKTIQVKDQQIPSLLGQPGPFLLPLPFLTLYLFGSCCFGRGNLESNVDVRIPAHCSG